MSEEEHLRSLLRQAREGVLKHLIRCEAVGCGSIATCWCWTLFRPVAHFCDTHAPAKGANDLPHAEWVRAVDAALKGSYP